MQNSPLEQILFLIALFLVALLQVLLGRGRQRRPGQTPDAESELPEGPPPPLSWADTKPPLADQAFETVPRQRLGQLPRRELRPHPGLASRRELREAVLLSVILGPCRAKDPPT